MRSEPHARSRVGRSVVLALVLGSAALVGSAQEPPKEVEEPGGKLNIEKRIEVDDEKLGGLGHGGTVGHPPDVQLDELLTAAENASSPALKELFTRYSVPFDEIRQVVASIRVQPIPIRQVEWPNNPDQEFDVTPLDARNKPLPDRRLRVGSVRGVEHFETLIQTETDELLKDQSRPALENLAVAEKLLSAALRYHNYARDRELRRGKTWDEVRKPLVAKLREVRLQLFDAATDANDGDRIRDVGALLLRAYPNDAAVGAKVGTARVTEAQRLLASDNDLDHIRAKQLLDEYEAQFPDAVNDEVKKARERLTELAKTAFQRARDKESIGDLTTARDELIRASALDPTVQGLREMQRRLRVGYQILRVGVWQYPQSMTPLTARLDSEKHAIELVFEGLLREVPEESGAVRYRPAAALGTPDAIPNGREFRLHAYDRDWAGRFGFNSFDVVNTLKILGEHEHTWAAYPLTWLGGAGTPLDTSTIRLPLSMPHPDPRAAFRFKMLPTRWMTDTRKSPQDPAFTERPFGNGPYRWYANEKPADKPWREMVFVDNPTYGKWPDRNGLPYIAEVRLVEVAKPDTTRGREGKQLPLMDYVEAFQDDPATRAPRLHILPDIPSVDIARFTGLNSPVRNRVQVVTSKNHRRVHILAVNLRLSYMQNKSLRQGLSLAIDRERVLQDVYRGGNAQLREYHEPMTGPFPPGSWASKDPNVVGNPPPLVNTDLAVARLKEYLSGTAPQTTIELAFPADDTQAEEACRRIKADVEAAGKDGPNGRQLRINLVGVPTRELLGRVMDEHRFELAYIPFDYPDDWYPYGLAAALDPQAGALGGRNCFGFLLQGSNPDADDQRLGRLLKELHGYRDFAGELAPRAREAGKLFNDCLPFIPLWQLDRHMVVHNRLKVFVDDSVTPVSPRLLNPNLLFQGVAHWRLD